MMRVCIFGAAGRMGQALIRCVKRLEGFAVTGAIEAVSHPDLGKDAGLLAGAGAAGVPISSDAAAALAGADVAVDFSTPTASAEHVRLAAAKGKPLVLGTTGLDAAQAASVREAARVIPVVWAPNMSLGVNFMFALVARAARVLSDYDIEIIETHHRHKKDAPSGTALRLAEAAAEARGLDPLSSIVHGRHGICGVRTAAQIGMHAVRGGDVVGDHTVLFAADGERIELTHRASSRDTFAMGALKAAAWAVGKPAALYDMQDVLGLRD